MPDVQLMTNDTPFYTYKPAIWRSLLVFTGLPIGAYLLGSSLRLLIDYASNNVGDLTRQINSMLIGIPIAAVLGSMLLLHNKDYFFITITPSTISGPSTTGIVGESTFSLAQLDLNSINQITFWDKFWMRRRIFSKDKEKIIISRLHYSKAQEDEIIKTLLSLVHQG